MMIHSVCLLANFSRKPPFHNRLFTCYFPVFFTSYNITSASVILNYFPLRHIPYRAILNFTKGTFEVTFQNRKKCKFCHCDFLPEIILMDFTQSDHVCLFFGFASVLTFQNYLIIYTSSYYLRGLILIDYPIIKFMQL